MLDIDSQRCRIINNNIKKEVRWSETAHCEINKWNNKIQNKEGIIVKDNNFIIHTLYNSIQCGFGINHRNRNIIHNKCAPTNEKEYC